MSVYEHVVASVEAGQLATVLAQAGTAGREAIARDGGRLFGLWKPLIGLSFNHVVAVVEWPQAQAPGRAPPLLLGNHPGVQVVQNDVWQATLRPAPGKIIRHDPGFVTHRWYDIEAVNLPKFLELTSNTWGNWEGQHDGEVLGLWRSLTLPHPTQHPERIRMRLMAWYRSMSVWENARHWKGTKGAETANSNLGARYDLTLDSAVSILQPALPAP
ncbi:MAG: hypothetical protein ACKVP7_10940 [Hyphomicrobiaceae bacterium]